MKLPKFVYYLNEPGSDHYYGTRHGAPFRSKPHAELQAKGTPYKVVEFMLMRLHDWDLINSIAKDDEPTTSGRLGNGE
jgi:hypothetical protein